MNYFCQDLCRKDPFSYEVSCAKVQQLFHVPVISPNIFLSNVSDHLTMSDVSHTFLYLYRWKVRGVGLDGEIIE